LVKYCKLICFKKRSSFKKHSSASHRGDQASTPRHQTWNLWRTKWHSYTFLSQDFSSPLPCQYHSNNVPQVFIHLPPTLYSVSLPVLQFPLSVSFHQCSILIHSSTLYNVFSPVLQVPLPVSRHQCSIFIHLPPTVYNLSM